MLRLRGLETVRISKVEGHADEALVRAGGARDVDRWRNNGADGVADFGRGRVPWWVIDARRNFSGVCVLVGAQLSLVCIGFFVAIARTVVNHDGEAGTSMDPTPCIVLRVGSILGFGVFLLWRCSFCVSYANI